MSKEVVNAFHNLYYDDKRTWSEISTTKWMGHRILKCPLDLWIYQEIFNEVRPDFIIETGTYEGGSAIYWASLCQLFGTGKVISIDIAPRKQPEHPNVIYITGDSIAVSTLLTVSDLVKGGGRIIVNLDSLHMYKHVLKELELYSQFVSYGSYLIVEDTNVNGHPAAAQHGPGPFEAVASFLAKHSEFKVDPSKEKFLMTFNPSGYLKRVG